MRGDLLLRSHMLLRLSGTQINIDYPERIPAADALLVVSNHRGLLDVPVLITAMNRPLRVVCHHFMGQTPGLRQAVDALGCLPLDPPGQYPRILFQQAAQLLQTGQPVGIFPEGAQPMIQPVPSDRVGAFQSGFAHLALRVPVKKLAVLPVAIATIRATTIPVAPFKLFQWLAPTEPLFARPGWHPAVFYRQVQVRIGQPRWITESQRAQYRSNQAAALVSSLTQTSRTDILRLLQKRD